MPFSTPFNPDAEVQGIQTYAETLATTTTMGFCALSRGQRNVIVMAMDSKLPNGAVRRAVLGRIYPLSGTTGKPVTSTNDLSEAQASALIRYCYGDQKLGKDTPLLERAERLMEGLNGH